MRVKAPIKRAVVAITSKHDVPKQAHKKMPTFLTFSARSKRICHKKYKD